MQKKGMYTTIFHRPRIEAGLTCNQYVLASTIFHMQKGGKVKGWCFATKEWFAELLGISKQSILNLIDSLITKGFVEKGENGRYLRVTDKWKNEIEKFDFCKESLPKKSKESLPKPKKQKVKKVYQDGKESLPETVKKVYPDYILDTNIDTDKDINKSPNGVFSAENLKDFEKQISEKAAQEKFEQLQAEREKLEAEKAEAELRAKEEAEKKKVAAKKKSAAEIPVGFFDSFDDPGKALSNWLEWEDYKKTEHRKTYKTDSSRKIAIQQLHVLSNGKAEIAKLIINQSRGNLWAGLFQLTKANTGQVTNNQSSKIINDDKYAKYAS